jgi:hypothetical protein
MSRLTHHAESALSPEKETAEKGVPLSERMKAGMPYSRKAAANTARAGASAVE